MNQALEKLKRQLDEAEAAVEARKKPPPETGPRVVGEGLVIDEWVKDNYTYITCKIFGLFIVVPSFSHLFTNVCVIYQKERREKYLARQQVEAIDSSS